MHVHSRLPAALALLLSLLAATGCRDTLPSLFLHIEDPQALGPTQLRVTVEADGLAPATVTRPEQARRIADGKPDVAPPPSGCGGRPHGARHGGSTEGRRRGGTCGGQRGDRQRKGDAAERGPRPASRAPARPGIARAVPPPARTDVVRTGAASPLRRRPAAPRAGPARRVHAESSDRCTRRGLSLRHRGPLRRGPPLRGWRLRPHVGSRLRDRERLREPPEPVPRSPGHLPRWHLSLRAEGRWRRLLGRELLYRLRQLRRGGALCRHGHGLQYTARTVPGDLRHLHRR